MTYAELKYEFNQMSTEEIYNWFFKQYGETIESLYGILSRNALIHELAMDNAQ